MTDINASPEPVDELGHIAAEMLEVLDNLDNVKGMVLLHGENNAGMLAMSGYDDGEEAMADLYEQFKVLCSHNGMSVVMIPVQQGQN